MVADKLIAHELSFMDHVKLFFRGWIDSKTKSNYVLYRGPKHGLVECKVSGYGERFSCQECMKSE